MPTLRATRRSVTAVALACAVLVSAGPAPPASAKVVTVPDGPSLWATINACDTQAKPDVIGIRGSMPGSGKAGERMYMRFRVQYLDPADGRWHNLDASGDSGFLALGSARYAARRTGRNFTITPPADGGYTLRGAVSFEWRRGSRVVRRARKLTEAGHPGTQGADPPTFSAATCVVSR